MCCSNYTTLARIGKKGVCWTRAQYVRCRRDCSTDNARHRAEVLQARSARNTPTDDEVPHLPPSPNRCTISVVEPIRWIMPERARYWSDDR